jgi:hypothetical protein
MAAGATVLASVGAVSAHSYSNTVMDADWYVSMQNWPETSGWATDTINRTMLILQKSLAPATDCGTTGGPCFLYEVVYLDYGTFVTNAGVAYPNSSIEGTEKGGLQGLLVGTAYLEFYTTSEPMEQTKPVTLADASVPSSEMFEMAFPAGTTFVLNAPAPVNIGYGDYISYQYVYETPLNGVWVDQVNWPTSIHGAANDDGQGPTDGNIYG